MKVLIIGASGQAGPILARNMLSSGAKVACTSRFNTPKGFHGLAKLGILSDVRQYVVDPTIFSELKDVIEKWEPEIIFHFAGAASPAQTIANPLSGLDFARTTLNLLEAVKLVNKNIVVRIASSGEVFEKKDGVIINENTPLVGNNLYAVEKITAVNLISIYRENFDINCAALHLFNHESGIRSEEFVTSKIVHCAIDISEGKTDTLQLGNLNVVRDWGWAAEFMQALKLSALHSEPLDFIVSTGTSISLKDFINVVFSELGLEPARYVKSNQNFLRVGETQEIFTDPSKICSQLNWHPTITGLKVPKMLLAEVLELRNGSSI